MTMIYQVDHQKQEVSLNCMSKDHMYVGMMNFDEFQKSYQILGISSQFVKRMKNYNILTQNEIILSQKYYYGIINLINAKNIFAKKDTFAFFIFDNLFLVIVLDDEDLHIENVFQSSSNYVLEHGVSITRFVYYFFIELITRDYQYIQNLQDEIEELETHDSKDESIQFTRKLRDLSKELLLLRNYYNNLVVVGEELQMNHHQIFEEDDMRYFEIFTQRIQRLSQDTQMLRELLHQASEAHQAQLDYHLNKTMQLFTVITSIFMPLTLIVGWYGMNFYNMPELHNPYGYPTVTVICLVIVIVLIIWFKKKKFF